jgi:tetratricopeptide (TPR) repeat protein
MRNQIAVVAFLLSFTLLAGAQSPSARDELNRGVEAYKRAKYEDAIHYFQSAVQLDPTLVVARLYLATALAQQYIPGEDSPENVRVVEAAISEYQEVLKIDPQSLSSLNGVAYLYLQTKKFQEAKTFYRKAIEIGATDAENYYSIGVIDWTQTYTRRMERRAKLRLKPEQSFIDTTDCWEIRNSNETLVKEGMEMIGKASN